MRSLIFGAKKKHSHLDISTLAG